MLLLLLKHRQKRNLLNHPAFLRLLFFFIASSCFANLSNNSFFLAMADSLVMLLYIENLGSSILPNNSCITFLSLPVVSANNRPGLISSVTTFLKNLSI